MAASEVALDHAAGRKKLAVAAAAYAAQQWGKVDRNNIAKSWLRLIPGVAAILSAAQLAAAEQADPYMAEAAPASTVEALVSAAAFAGAAADGRSLAGLLFQPVILALRAIGRGSDVERAMAGGAAKLDMIVRTEVADAGRVADQVAMTAHPEVDGYIRVVVGDTCNRCIILAGRWYRYSEGFARHPRCDCIMLPASQAEAAGLVQDPMAIYSSMTERERAQAGWSEADQKAIEAGADINQVTNAQRSTYTAGGRQFTRDSTTKRGIARGRLRARMTPDQIFIEAGDDRDKAIELLRKHGYLIGGGTSTPDDAQQRAVDRQAAIDKVRARAEFLAEVEEVAVINEATGDELARMVRRAADRFGVADDPAFAALLRRADHRDAVLMEGSIEDAADELGLTRIGGDLGALQVIPFDRTRHSMVPGERQPQPGTFVEVVRPGYEAEVDGERLTLLRAVVDNTDKRPDSVPPRETPPGPARTELPVVLRFDEFGTPFGATGRIQGPFREVPEAIDDVADEIQALAQSGAGFSTVRRAALDQLDTIMGWLGSRPDIRDQEQDIRDRIEEGLAPEGVVALVRSLASAARRPFGERLIELERDDSPAFDPNDLLVDLEQDDNGDTGSEENVDFGDEPSIVDLIPANRAQAIGRERFAAVKQAVAERLDGEYAGLRVAVSEVDLDIEKLTVTAAILDNAGNPVGTTVRQFFRDRDGPFVYHALLTLDPHVQGQGFAEAWNNHLMDWYVESGLVRIEVTANIDVGGYTWARQGFDWASKGPALAASNRLEREVSMNAHLYDAEQQAAVDAIVARMALPFDDDRFPTAYEMSQVGRKPGQGKNDAWPGKNAMLGSTWSGVKPVPNRAS